MKVQWKVDGSKNAADSLRELPKKLANKTMVAAQMAAAQVVEEEGRSNVRSRAYDTGLLEESIRRRAKWGKGRESLHVFVGVFKLSKRMSKRIGKKLGIKGEKFATKYARFIEFGTAKMTPRPVMLPALLKKKDEYTRRLVEEYRVRIPKAVDEARRGKR